MLLLILHLIFCMHGIDHLNILNVLQYTHWKISTIFMVKTCDNDGCDTRPSFNMKGEPWN
jgi:hypothetical protein